MSLSIEGSFDPALAVSPLLDPDTAAGSAALEAGEATIQATYEDLARRAADAAANRVSEGALIAGLSGGEVTPEMILATARRRINDLDSQVATIMDELNRRTTSASEISRDLGELRIISSDLEAYYDDSGHLNLDASMTHLRGSPTVRDYVAALDVDPTERSSIADGREGLQGLIDGANERLRDVNSGNEMLMIQMQSTMQSRTSVIQTATNLLKTLDEANDSVVGNLR